MNYYLTETVENSTHKNWKGGFYYQGGYKLLKVKSHPNSNKRGYVSEHRLVMEHHLNRYLSKDEVIHHINGIKDDNRIENLEVVYNNALHIKEHNKNIKRDNKGKMLPTDPMLEDIKIRLYNKDRGYTKEYSLSKLINTTYRRGCFEFRGRSTGLKDENGKLIYEGDIVKLSGEDPYSNCQFTTDYDWEYVGKVQEFDCAWEVCGKDSSSIWLYEYLNKDEVETIEIIGNIYENKEFLEV